MHSGQENHPGGAAPSVGLGDTGDTRSGGADSDRLGRRGSPASRGGAAVRGSDEQVARGEPLWNHANTPCHHMVVPSARPGTARACGIPPAATAKR